MSQNHLLALTLYVIATLPLLFWRLAQASHVFNTTPVRPPVSKSGRAFGWLTLLLAVSQSTSSACAATYTVYMHSPQGYCTAQGTGGGKVTCNAAVVGPWEKWTLTVQNGENLVTGAEVSLQAEDGQYMTAGNGGGPGSLVKADANVYNLWERWIVETLDGHKQISSGDFISLRTYYKRTYFSSNGGGQNQAAADRTQRQIWEDFQITLVPAITSFGHASASQAAVLRVERDIFKNGGWYFKWKDPAASDSYAYGETAIQIPLANEVPAGSTITSAVLSWNFVGLSSQTTSTIPTVQLNGKTANPPKGHGSSTFCQYVPACSPASMDHWGPDAAYWANRVQIEGKQSYSFPGPPRGASGLVDLLKIYNPADIAGHTLTFVATLQYGVGRPFFATEGRNADTEFDVSGGASVNVSATLTVEFIRP